MRNLSLLLFAAFVLFNCNQKSKEQTTEKPGKKTEDTGYIYIISKDGIGELKIGMTQSEVEKLLNQQFPFNAMKDSAGYWQDTVKAKYKDIEVSLYFERQYNENDVTYMQLSGVETNSSLCKTASGIGAGDEKSAILSAYDDSPIDMGPVYEAVNKDDKYDRELIFHLVNKKVSSLEAAVILGD
jgi:hypothetical protein